MARAYTLIAIAVGILSVSSQSISNNCQAALTSVATNPDASACLNPSALVQLFLVGSNSSVVQPINTWITGLCSSPSCSNDTIAAAVTNVTSGCSSELSAAGISTASSGSIVAAVQAAYPTVRQAICLSDSGTNCITQTLTNIQTIVGPLTLTNILAIAANPNSVDLPSNVTCTNCIKEAYNVVNENYPSLLSGQASQLQSTCGSSFTDGTTPSGITETASTATATKDNGGTISAGDFLGLSISALAALATTFVLALH